MSGSLFLTLCGSETADESDGTISPWLAGLNISDFEGSTLGERVAQAAHALGAHVLSPSAESYVSPAPDPAMEGYRPFTTREMVREAKRLGLAVKPWTVRCLSNHPP